MSVQKKLLILGANVETAGLVKTAKEMGIYTVVADYLPNSYAKKFADQPEDIDGMDIEKLVHFIRKEKIDGVMVGTADPLVPSYYKVCKILGLPCYVTEESVEAFTNKRKFKNICKKFGINGVSEYTVDQIRENKNVEYPVLIKPADGRSGRGMSVCYSAPEVEAGIEKALEVSRCGEVLIERYMECEDVFMYYTFQNGKCYLSAMTDRHVSREQKGLDPVVLGGIYPSKYIGLYMDTLHGKMCKMFEYLNIKNGVLLIQAFVENENFYVYDPGFRLQGGAPHILVNGINHIDHLQMLVNFALTGKMGEYAIESKNDYMFGGKAAASQVILLRKGVIGKIEGIDAAKSLQGVISATQRLFEGDEVSLVGTEQQILVRFHMVCDTLESLHILINKINELIHRNYDKVA